MATPEAHRGPLLASRSSRLGSSQLRNGTWEADLRGKGRGTPGRAARTPRGGRSVALRALSAVTGCTLDGTWVGLSGEFSRACWAYDARGSALAIHLLAARGSCVVVCEVCVWRCEV